MNKILFAAGDSAVRARTTAQVSGRIFCSHS